MQKLARTMVWSLSATLGVTTGAVGIDAVLAPLAAAAQTQSLRSTPEATPSSAATEEPGASTTTTSPTSTTTEGSTTTTTETGPIGPEAAVVSGQGDQVPAGDMSRELARRHEVEPRGVRELTREQRANREIVARIKIRRGVRIHGNFRVICDRQRLSKGDAGRRDDRTVERARNGNRSHGVIGA